MATEQPNIILVMTDQQRFDTISALGFPYMETPNLDRLVTEGVTLSQCYISAPSQPWSVENDAYRQAKVIL